MVARALSRLKHLPELDALQLATVRIERPDSEPRHGLATVDEKGDGGVIEIGENLALETRAHQIVRRTEIALRQLEGGLLLVLRVVTGDQVDGAHAALAEQA